MALVVHASCVALAGRAVLLLGESGAGKSDVALRLIELGGLLVSDDQTVLELSEDGELVASSPPAIAGLIEVRHVGLYRVPFVQKVPVVLAVELCFPGDVLPRLPETYFESFLDRPVQKLKLVGCEASTPVKIKIATREERQDD